MIEHPRDQIPLAHSAPSEGEEPDPYARHVAAVREGALERANAMLRYSSHPDGELDLLGSVRSAAVFHDLGKLDPDIQAALRKGRGPRLRWDHIDAGVAHLSAANDWMAAWMVRAHHPPGLPENQEHFDPDGLGRRLRGRRRDHADQDSHEEQMTRTNKYLPVCLSVHQIAAGNCTLHRRRPTHGLAMRLGLSCLVDADHTDTAFFDNKRLPPKECEPRWPERLEAMQRYVNSFPLGKSEAERTRNLQRAAFFQSCLHSPLDEPMVTCEGPVGLGKTTAVTGYLMRRAQDEGLRRLIIIAPYTNILRQTAKVLRKAVVLPNENPHRVVMEHHHRADFKFPEDRDLAVLWRAPIILTTAVTFFETLSSCEPGSLRKLHALPGSAVFLDEAHAALPTRLWAQNWQWMCELADKWGCRFVLASGSLARFWENPRIVQTPTKLPELLRQEVAKNAFDTEATRIRYEPAADGKVLTVDDLIALVAQEPGPRLLILNTIQNAAIVAKAMRAMQCDVLHLSTALTPHDRAVILKQIQRRLSKVGSPDWTLVATSCVESGVDLSFRCAFRERFTTASTIQTGGRVNRHGEYDKEGAGIVYDFAVAGEGITQHPAARHSADILRGLMAEDRLNQSKPADIVTVAMERELDALGGLAVDRLLHAEAARDYPEVQARGRVIDADTRFVVIDEVVKRRLIERRPVRLRKLLNGSVQLWASRIDRLKLERLPGRREVYTWDDIYEPGFLGYMAGVLRNDRFLSEGGAVI